jgi:hypothetical protein
MKEAAVPSGLNRTTPALAEFLSSGQVTALRSGSVEMIELADKAALAEAIQRSLSSQAFEALGCAAAPSVETQSQSPASPIQSRAGSPGESSCATDVRAHDVAREVAEEQLAMRGPLNHAFRQYLAAQGMRVLDSPTRGNNCAIYSLLNLIKPELTGAAREIEAKLVRDDLDQLHPRDRGAMLYFDGGVGGVAHNLLSLVNARYECNVRVGIVASGMEDGHPVIGMGTYCGAPSGGSGDFTHSLAIWEQGNHYEAITYEAPHSAPHLQGDALVDE